MNHSRLPLLLITGLLVAPLASCDEDVRTYEVITPQSATTQNAAPAIAAEPKAPASPPVEAPTAQPAQAGNLRWTLPEGWKQLDGQRPMRVATFQTGDGKLEVALTRFPGDTGGLLANVNRWRQQTGLPPIADADLAAALQPTDNGSLRGHTLRLRGEQQYLLGAILSPADGSETYFLKAMSDPALIDTHEAAFITFAKSLTLANTQDNTKD